MKFLNAQLPGFVQPFPKLKRVILLDDDVVVQPALSPLWYLDLNGNVIGAVTAIVPAESSVTATISRILSFIHPDWYEISVRG